MSSQGPNSVISNKLDNILAVGESISNVPSPIEVAQVEQIAQVAPAIDISTLV